jgi:hypothetical protein
MLATLRNIAAPAISGVIQEAANVEQSLSISAVPQAGGFRADTPSDVHGVGLLPSSTGCASDTIALAPGCSPIAPFWRPACELKRFRKI